MKAVSEEKESQYLQELKELITAAPGTPSSNWMKNASDIELMRFLRGHLHNTKEAFEFVKNCSQWRYEKNVARIVDEHESPAASEKIKFLKQYWPYGRLGVMPDGDTVVQMTRMALIDYSGLLREFQLNELVDLNVYLFEKEWKDYPKGRSFLIMDMSVNPGEDNILNSFSSVKSYISSLLTLTKAVTSVSDPYYPESYRKIYFTRPPYAFWAAWKVAKLFVAKYTLEKINILDEKEAKKLLGETMPKQVIPCFLGGENQSHVPSGGIIKERLFT